MTVHVDVRIAPGPPERFRHHAAAPAAATGAARDAAKPRSGRDPVAYPVREVEAANNFPYAELAEAIDRRARRFGVPVIRVDPAYTSVEGRWRFAGNLGWSVHEAAALCIGRRAMGHRRRFGRRLRERLGVVRSALAAEAGRRTDEAKRWTKTGSPEEGRARTIAAGCRRIGTVLGQERLLRSGGIGEGDLAGLRARDFSRWRRRRGARDGPFAALVMLQRVRWGRALLAGSAENP